MHGVRRKQSPRQKRTKFPRRVGYSPMWGNFRSGVGTHTSRVSLVDLTTTSEINSLRRNCSASLYRFSVDQQSEPDTSEQFRTRRIACTS
jgi:hypothetical protein